jgi:hypothetical protein
VPCRPVLAEVLAGDDDPCAQEELRYYNMGLHIGSVFILLGVSLLGSLAPVALHISSTSKNTTTAIRLGTYFGVWCLLKWVACACPIRRPACDHSSAGPAGFGTILATAFIHMQLPAVESLSNSCLPAFWTETYEAWPFLFCTTAVMCMQSLDFLIKVCARFPGLVTHNEFTNWQPALRCASIPSKLSAAASQLICPAPWLQGFLRRQGTGLEMIESGHAGDSPMHGCHTAVIGAMLSIQPPATQHPSQPHDAEAGEFTESGGGGSCLHFNST